MEISLIPRWLISQFNSEFRIQNELNILISNALILIVFIVFNSSLIDIMNSLPHFCLFDKAFGIECPVCGTTRAFCELATGNLNQAYKLNFSSFFVASFFIFQIPLRAISLYNNSLIYKVNRISKYFSYAVCIVIFANWVIKVLIQH